MKTTWSSWAVAVLVLVASGARAQQCEFPICPVGTSFRESGTDSSGPYASCGSCNWWGYCSHQLVRCPAGSWFDVPNQQCVHNECSGCGGELPLCDLAGGETYTGHGVDPATGNTYGVCEHRWLTYIAHRLVQCREGWSLVTATGNCHKNCLPDLVPSSKFFFRDASGSYVSSVRAGRPYSVCLNVFNSGTAWAGSFRVTGGGLVVRTPPQATVSSLAPGSYQAVCLYYSSAPAPGTWRVGIAVDSGGSVTESNESNNGLTVTVNVVP